MQFCVANVSRTKFSNQRTALSATHFALCKTHTNSPLSDEQIVNPNTTSDPGPVRTQRSSRRTRPTYNTFQAFGLSRTRQPRSSLVNATNTDDNRLPLSLDEQGNAAQGVAETPAPSSRRRAHATPRSPTDAVEGQLLQQTADSDAHVDQPSTSRPLIIPAATFSSSNNDSVPEARRSKRRASSSDNLNLLSVVPPNKARRMQVGGNPNLSSHSCTRSVADRIKGINLNDQQQQQSQLSDGASRLHSHTNAATTSPPYLTDGVLLDGCLENTVAANLQHSLLCANGNGTSVDALKARQKHQTTASSIANSSTRRPVQPPPHLNDFQRNTIRIIGQYLSELGLNSATEALVEETGCRVEHPLAVRLRQHVRECSWLRALETLDRLRALVTDAEYTQTRVLLIEERVKELLARRNTLAALELLQLDYPIEERYQQRREFYSTLLFRDPEEVSQALSSRDQDVTVEVVLEALHKILPNSLLLAPNRFKNICDQAWSYQKDRCELHDDQTTSRVKSSDFVLKDHSCSSSSLPSKCSQMFFDHRSEVWTVQFSPCGRYLATGARSNDVFIYHLSDPKSLQLSFYRRISIPDQFSGIATISWSADSLYLACTVQTANPPSGVYIVNAMTGRFKGELKPSHEEHSYCAGSFFQDQSHRLVCAGYFGDFETKDIDEKNSSQRFSGFRVKCAVALKDGKSVIAADSHNRIRLYNFETLAEQTLFKETAEVMHFVIDPTEQYCLVTTKDHGLKLWCVRTRTNVGTFRGTLHKEFHIQSTFGGKNGEFMAAGSQDGRFLIWNRRSADPVHDISAHQGQCVNSCSWNPVYPQMLATGGDDGTVQIWLPEAVWERQRHSSNSSLYSLNKV